MTPRIVVLLCSLLLGHSVLQGETWPQFRGPNLSGKSTSRAALPNRISPDDHVLWKTSIPPGHSSPVVSDDHIYLTAVRGEKQLLLICLNRQGGQQLWEREIPYETLEKIHRIGSLAQPSPVTDGERVLCFFGSSGLWCFDRSGKHLWHQKFGPFKNDFGSGSSPILVGDKVLLCQDHDTDSFLMALDKRTGKKLWVTDRAEFPRIFSTPVIWDQQGRRQIVVAATLRIIGYDLENGQELWTVRDVARIVNMSPIVGDDGILYAACWSPGGDEDHRINVDPFPKFAQSADANKNGTIELNEVQDPQVKQRFSQIDRDKSGQITSQEWENMRKVFDDCRNRIVAIKPGGTGDITQTHVLWSYNKHLPYCPSPLYSGGTLFMVKDGGIFSSLNASDGKPIKQKRIQGNLKYFASPVLGDGKIFVASEDGIVNILRAAPQWEPIDHADFKEPIFGTPAIVDGRIYLRTHSALYCFGLNQTASR